MGDIIQLLAQSELLNGESVQICTEDESRNEVVNTSPIELIPDEIIDKHIFIYFSLHYCIDYFRPICKKWKRICERSNNPNRLLRLIGYRIDYTFLNLVRLYQPSAIQLQITSEERIPSIYSVIQLIRASKRCHTLILRRGSIERAPIKPISSIQLPQITTLCIGVDDLDFLDFFPNVQYLHLVTEDWDKIKLENLPVHLKKLAISTDSWSDGTIAFAGSIDEVKKYLGQSDSRPNYIQMTAQYASKLSQIEYSVLYEISKLADLMIDDKIDEARAYLKSGNFSLQTEIEMFVKKGRYLDYVFGLPVCYRFLISTIFAEEDKLNGINRDLYELFNTVCIDIPLKIRLLIEPQYGTMDEVMQTLTAALKQDKVERKRSLIMIALLDVLQRNEFLELLELDQSVRAVAVDILHRHGRWFFEHCTDPKQFEIIAPIVDWNIFAPYYPEGCILVDPQYVTDARKALFKNAMQFAINNGSAENYSSKDFFTSILRYINDTYDWDLLDAIIVQRPALIRDFLFQDPNHHYIETLIDRYNYDITSIVIEIVRSKSVWPKLLQKVPVDWDRVVATTGRSPFVELVTACDAIDIFTHLLNAGVDPRKTPKNSETVLCAVIKSSGSSVDKMELIDMILSYGVDINEPSLYEGSGNQYFDILKIAELTGQSETLINFLKSRGAK